MKLSRILSLSLFLSTPILAATANLQFVNDTGGSGVFVFRIDGQLRRVFCTQFLPNATTLPYQANVASLANLTGSVLATQGDPQALLKYQQVAILNLRALADPSLAVDVVRASRRIVDGFGPLTPGAQALYDFALAANPAAYDLTGFRIYTNASTQEVTAFETGFVQVCKVAGVGIPTGTSFTFTLPAITLTVNAGVAPGNCSRAIEVPIGSVTINETIPANTRLTSISTSPANLLTSSNLSNGTATVTVTSGGQTIATFINSSTFNDPNSNSGFVQICKVAGAGVTVGTNYTFNVGGIATVVPAGPAPNGSCSPPVAVTSGSVAITETIPSGFAVSSISALPSDLLLTSNLAAGTATVAVASGGQTIVTFTNTMIPAVNTGFVQVCKVAGAGVAPGTNFNFLVAGNPISVLAGVPPAGSCGTPIPVLAGLISVSETLSTGTRLASITTQPPGLLNASNLTAGTATVIVNPGGQTTVTFLNTFINALPPVVENSYQIRYASHLNLGDSVVNITNTGAGGASLAAGTSASTTGAFCANVYTFSPDEQMVSCCSCPVTPNGLVSLSARNDLISNPLTPAVPTSIVIKLVASRPSAGTCAGSAANISPSNLAAGLAAWGTTLHRTVGEVGPQTTETPFLPATLSTTPGEPGEIGELNRLAQLCTFINANGSGFGICRSCRLGGLGSGRL